MNLRELTLREVLLGIKEKKFVAYDVTRSCLQAIEEKNGKLNAYIYVNKNGAEDSGVGLKSLPIAIKDNILTKGIRTTASSKVLENYIPQYNATIISKLLENGAYLLGKTNLDAWAHGSSTETSDFGPTLNPWDTTKLPGGSSGGSAAAVSADLCIAALGTETAGSIRQPSSWCGVVGLKPTYGRVSRYGIISMASSTDSPGPITKCVWDAAFLLSVISGIDPFDATTIDEPSRDYTRGLENPVKGIKIGIPKEYLASSSPEVSQKVMDAVKILEGLGCAVKEVSLLDPSFSIAVYTIIQRSEVSSNLARYDGIRYGNSRESFGEEAKRRIMLGTYTLSAGYYDAFYKRAEKVRTLIVEDFKRVFREVDLIAGPVSPSVALSVGSSKNHPMFGEVSDVLVEPSSIAGLPGITVPCGFIESLPVGLGIIGPRLSEELILNVAYHYEQSTPWHEMKPKI